MKRPFRIKLPALAAVALLTLLAVTGVLALGGGESEDPGPDMGLLFLPDEEETEGDSSSVEQEPSTEPENETEQSEQPAPPQENLPDPEEQVVNEGVSSNPQEAPSSQQATPSESLEQPSSPPSQTTVPNPQEEAEPSILIAYFTWADNTVVENWDEAVQSALEHYESIGDSNRYEGVDATTSASVVPPGNAAQLAVWIQQEVGGDLHSIVVEDMYPSNYDECLDRAAEEKAENARPALTTHVDNMEDYDIVFLGFPNWWYTLPMPVLSFVDEYEWSGKTVIPFVTHGTGGLSATIRDLTPALGDGVTVLDPIGVYRPDVPYAQPDIREWIAGLNLEE